MADAEKENTSFLWRYWSDRNFDKKKGYAKPITRGMSLSVFAEQGYLPQRGCAYLLVKNFWRRIFQLLGMKTALLFCKRRPVCAVQSQALWRRFG